MTAVMGIFAVIVIFGIIASAVREGTRETYSSPQVSMEGVGVNKTLDPVEASVLLRQPPEKTLGLLLFSLIKKGYVRAYSHTPLKLAVLYERDLSETERLFLDAIDRTTGEIDGAKLAPCWRYLVTSVNEKMRPYCRRDTEEYYRGVIRQAWEDMKSAQSPEVRLANADRDFLWLIQDEEMMRASNEEGRQQIPVPQWYLHGYLVGQAFGFPYYLWPHQIYGQYSGIYSQMLDEDQKTNFRAISEEIWTPAESPRRRGPFVSGHGGYGGHPGGFTTPSCACACACVSCACACACAGGGGCT